MVAGMVLIVKSAEVLGPVVDAASAEVIMLTGVIDSFEVS